MASILGANFLKEITALMGHEIVYLSAMKQLLSALCLRKTGLWLSSFLYIALASGMSAEGPDPQIWPLREKVDLSSGFGDFRNGRFHAGVDLRTGGTVGKRIFSPVDGYISRVKMSYDGYGKGLYLHGNDNHIYVFGHLLGFAPEIDKPVKLEQTKHKRYYIDKEFPADSIPVTKGQLLGWTGQSGVGAPHLHFEKRTADNFPLNPLKFGFSISDVTRPTINQLGFQLTDDKSLFDDGSRKRFIKVKNSQNGKYTIDSILFMHRPFGVLIDCFDNMRVDGMKQAVYSIKLSVDETIIYESIFDTLDFDIGQSVKHEYDYVEAVSDKPTVRTLYHKTGNKFSGSKAMNGSRGIVGMDGSLDPGLHYARISVSDAFGNSSELTFNFVWGMPTSVFALDSTKQTSDSTKLFFFTAAKGYENLKIDSINVQQNNGKLWKSVAFARVQEFEGNKLIIDLTREQFERLAFRLSVFSGHGCVIHEPLFSGLLPFGQKRVVVSHWIEDEGMVIHAESNALTALEANAYLYYQDSLLGRIPCDRMYHMSSYFFYVPPRLEYDRIDKIQVKLSADTIATPPFTVDSLSIVCLGYKEMQMVRLDSVFTITFKKDDVFEPRFVSFRKSAIVSRGVLNLNSDHYEIFPEVFATQANFALDLTFPDTNAFTHLSGLCWLDKGKDKWTWLPGNTYDTGYLHASSGGGGSFTAVFDYDKPAIQWLNIVPGRYLDNLQPKIEFRINEELSGIADDRNIEILLNKQWMIPEYDSEKKVCSFQPLEPLPIGEQHLAVVITDRAGNKTEEYIRFNVQAPKPNASKSRGVRK